jgi:hypothetical protein
LNKNLIGLDFSVKRCFAQKVNNNSAVILANIIKITSQEYKTYFIVKARKGYFVKHHQHFILVIILSFFDEKDRLL